MSDIRDSLITMDKMPPVIKHGVMYIMKKPVYIIELIEDGGTAAEYVTVYEVEQNSKPPIKAYKKTVRQQGFKKTTLLGQLASERFKIADKIEKITNPPLFMATLTYGVDTFSRKEGRGFYEREKDDIIVSAKGVQVQRGDQTGVFINLDSITWEKAYVAPGDILKEFNARKALWFDL